MGTEYNTYQLQIRKYIPARKRWQHRPWINESELKLNHTEAMLDAVGGGRFNRRVIWKLSKEPERAFVAVSTVIKSVDKCLITIRPCWINPRIML